jgi:hypothetical protein
MFQGNRISEPEEIEPYSSGEKSMYVLIIVLLSSKNSEKKYLHVRNGNVCGYVKFKTEIHLFVDCTKRTKIRTLRSKLQSS